MNIISGLSFSSSESPSPPAFPKPASPKKATPPSYTPSPLEQKLRAAAEVLGIKATTPESVIQSFSEMAVEEDELLQEMQELYDKHVDYLNVLQEEERDFAARRFDAEADIKRLSNISARNEKMIDVLNKIKSEIECPICTEPSQLPMVIGTCGHTACVGCLKNQEEAVTTSEAYIKEHDPRIKMLMLLEKTRCSLCRTKMLGHGFPVLALKGIVETIINFEEVNVGEKNKVEYPKESPERSALAISRMRYIPEETFAKYVIDTLFAKISNEQWESGVYLSGISLNPLFYQSFILNLQKKEGISLSQNLLLSAIAVKKKLKPEYPENGYATLQPAIDKVNELILFMEEVVKQKNEISLLFPPLKKEDAEEISTLALNLELATSKAVDAVRQKDAQTKLPEISDLICKTLIAKVAYGKWISKRYPTCVDLFRGLSFRILIFSPKKINHEVIHVNSRFPIWR